MVALQEQEEGIHRQGSSRWQARLVTKISVKFETAELVKIYCVLNSRKMVDFTTEVLERELREFRKQLENMRKLKTGL